MFNKLYLTIKSNEKISDLIIRQISNVLISWGINDKFLVWDMYSSRAKLEVLLEDSNYQSYLIPDDDMNELMAMCFEFEFVMTVIDNNGEKETYTTYYSKPSSSMLEIDESMLI